MQSHARGFCFQNIRMEIIQNFQSSPSKHKFPGPEGSQSNTNLFIYSQLLLNQHPVLYSLFPLDLLSDHTLDCFWWDAVNSCIETSNEDVTDFASKWDKASQTEFHEFIIKKPLLLPYSLYKPDI